MRQHFINGRIYTGELPFQEAFSVADGVFLKVGSNEKILSDASPQDEIIDLSGRFVCAGFNDSHMHLLNFGQTLNDAPLWKHTGSLSDLIDSMKEHLENHPPKGNAWLCGRGWNQDYFEDANRMPERRDLDRISTEIPIMITRACGHCCVVNTKALELARIDNDTAAPDGGAIGRDGDGPDGRFFDNAMDLIMAARPDPDIDDIKEMIRSASSELNRYGITSVQSDDYCVFRNVDPELINRAYRELERDGSLSVRVYEQCNFTGLKDLESFVNAGNVSGKGTDLFRIGPLKMLGDGALGSRTAHLSKPYNDSPDNSGFSLFSAETFNEMISFANSHGMQAAVHTIGDACLDTVLDAYEKALAEHPKADHRHGIIHCQITRSDQLERIARLGLHVYAQSVFLDYDNHIVEKLVDPSIAKTSYNWKTLMDMGVSVSNGSDCPVEHPDVMKGIECAVTRRSLDGTGPYLMDQAFSVREAIDSFTLRSAEASFEERFKGRIAPGYVADFTVLGEDPFRCDASSIHSISVIMTCLGGRCVYKA
ncbi:MAG: amidohydrolase [Clostridia bacterium]|nr:amidohydrolase [Clostridia bacterium]